ncbi:GIY-YIG nuclease family protein [bacterium]|nr:GIY-YIG nuclease family protein [bacterium]
MNSLTKKIKELTEKPGVYIFKDRLENIIYIGKAKNLRKRVVSHFRKSQNWHQDFKNKVKSIEIIESKSEKEAMILEAEFIKKYQPKYNVEWRDDKNYFFVGLTKEKFPRVFISHQPDKQSNAGKTNKKFSFIGPFVKGKELKNLLKELRKIFPFRTCKNLPKKPCLYFDLFLCPAPCINRIEERKYNLIINGLKSLLLLYQGKKIRIEAYDISNLSGSLASGSMAVIKGWANREISKYRRFKIKSAKGGNDVACLKEIITRRLSHKEWKMPDLILLDGGRPQLKAIEQIDVPSIALAKIKKSSGKIYSHFSKSYILIDNLPENIRNTLLLARDEAHRFAISYHKLRRKKEIISGKNEI